MSAQLYTVPYQCVIVSGLAVPGATMTFYLTGTSTKTPTYTTSALTTQNANPITANGAGAFTAIYLSSAITYRVVIKDSAGATLQDTDPYIPGVTTLGITLTTASGATVNSRLALSAIAAPVVGQSAIFDGSIWIVEAHNSTLTTADTAQGVYVRSTTDTSKMWTRQFRGPLYFDWFCSLANDFTQGAGSDCLASWTALTSYLDATDVNVNQSFVGNGPQIVFTGPQYYFSDTIQVKRSLRIAGLNASPGAQRTILRFAANKAGIVVNRSNTLGDVADSPATTDGGSTIIENLLLYSDGGTPNDTITTDLLYSGIRLRATASVRDCEILNFRGAGICVSADSSSATSDPFYGNASECDISNNAMESNKTGGVYVSGGDANISKVSGCRAINNGRFGFYDGSFLGNYWTACHARGNGLTANTGINQTGTVTQGGRHYALRPGKTHADAVATTPGTSATVWMDMGTGGVTTDYPAWSATPTITYVPSGSYGHTGSANASVFAGCYFETDQPQPMVGDSAIVLGGFMGTGLIDGAPHLRSSSFGLSVQRPIGQRWTYTDASTAYVSAGGDFSNTSGTGMLDLLSWYSSAADGSVNTLPATLAQEKATMDLVFMPKGSQTSGIEQPFRLTGDHTARTYGRVAADNRFITEIYQLALGNGNGARVMTLGAAAPSSGYHAVGEVVWNDGSITGIAAASYWQCSVAGTPGTWVVK